MWRNIAREHSEQTILGRGVRLPPFWHFPFEILLISLYYDPSNYELRKISLKIRFITKDAQETSLHKIVSRN